MTTTRSFAFGRTRIDYRLVRGRRRTVAVRVDPMGDVEVAVPTGFDEARLPPLLKAKAPWIVQKRQLVAEQVVAPRVELVTGERLAYLGRRYQLRVSRVRGAEPSVTFDGKRWLAVVPADLTAKRVSDAIRPMLVAWYRAHAETQLAARVERLARVLGVKPTRVVVREQARRWGSCSTSGVVAINWRIVMAPASTVDYVVAHELAHLVARDHGPRFWRTVAAAMPDFEVRREWLRRHGAELAI